MATNVKSIIDSAARKIGILAGGGESLESDEYRDALAVLAQMLDGWSLEDLMIPFNATEQLALDPERNFYSIGSGGDWETVRPEKIETLRILSADGRSHPVAITSLSTLAEYPDLTQRRPTRYAVNRDARFVYVEFDAYPEAGSAALLTSLKPFNVTALEDFSGPYDPEAEPTAVPASGFRMTGITAPIDFPSGYLQAIIYNLAVHMAAEYGKAVSAEVGAFAGNAKRLIKRRNIRELEARIPAGAMERCRRGVYDIVAGPCG